MSMYKSAIDYQRQMDVSHELGNLSPASRNAVISAYQDPEMRQLAMSGAVPGQFRRDPLNDMSLKSRLGLGAVTGAGAAMLAKWGDIGCDGIPNLKWKTAGKIGLGVGALATVIPSIAKWV